MLSFFLASTALGRVRLHRSAVDAQALAYDYSHHGEDWIQGTCASRQRQSPVDFPADGSAITKGKLSYSYQVVASGFELANTGHALVADFAGMGYGGVTYENGWYNLLNVALHSASEHTFGGEHYPLEMQLVHKKFDSDAILTVAILFDVADANTTMPGGVDESPLLNFFTQVTPPVVNQKVVSPASELNALDFNKLLENGLLFEYSGSLTAPPCAEIVTWFVRRDPVIASAAQIAVVQKALMDATAGFGNYRTAMPMNGRPVVVRTAVHEEPPPSATAPTIPIGPNPRTDREFRATQYAKDALKVATSATSYVKDLDQRLRRAALAHARALAPDLTDLVPTVAPVIKAQDLPEPTDEVDVAATAAAMARSISAAASSAIDEAKASIATEARLAAEAAASETAKMVSDLPAVEPAFNTEFTTAAPTTPPPGAGPTAAPAAAGEVPAEVPATPEPAALLLATPAPVAPASFVLRR